MVPSRFQSKQITLPDTFLDFVNNFSTVQLHCHVFSCLSWIFFSSASEPQGEPQPYGGFLKWWYPQNAPKCSFLVGKPMVVVLGTTILGNPQTASSRPPPQPSDRPPQKECRHFQEERGWKESGGPAPLEWRFPHFQSGSFGQLHLVGLWFG